MAKKITELTELTTYATNDLLIIEDVSTSTTKKITWANLVADNSVTFAKAAPGFVVQVANFQTGTMATGTTTTPIDNTIPQITEGTEFMTLAYTPKSATNQLVIDVVAYGGHSAAANSNVIIALFQDATANALASGVVRSTTSSFLSCSLRHKMTAGTTSSTTFRVRIGGDLAGTFTFNGVASTAYLGGTIASNITITEYKA